jgi:hypothetical protein
MSTPSFRDKFGTILCIGDMITYASRDKLRFGKILDIDVQKGLNGAIALEDIHHAWQHTSEAIAMVSPGRIETLPKITVLPTDGSKLLRRTYLSKPKELLRIGGIPKEVMKLYDSI